MAHRSRIFFISRRSAKEKGSADVTRPLRSQLANWRGVTWRILSKSALLYTVQYGSNSLADSATNARRHYLQIEPSNATIKGARGCGEPGSFTCTGSGAHGLKDTTPTERQSRSFSGLLLTQCLRCENW